MLSIISLNRKWTTEHVILVWSSKTCSPVCPQFCWSVHYNQEPGEWWLQAPGVRGVHHGGPSHLWRRCQDLQNPQQNRWGLTKIYVCMLDLAISHFFILYFLILWTSNKKALHDMYFFLKLNWKLIFFFKFSLWIRSGGFYQEGWTDQHTWLLQHPGTVRLPFFDQCMWRNWQ